ECSCTKHQQARVNARAGAAAIGQPAQELAGLPPALTRGIVAGVLAHEASASACERTGGRGCYRAAGAGASRPTAGATQGQSPELRLRRPLRAGVTVFTHGNVTDEVL
ncbi:MAG: hypothetical protein ACRDFS_13780, partial [Chloroflexota bacterium]